MVLLSKLQLSNRQMASDSTGSSKSRKRGMTALLEDTPSTLGARNTPKRTCAAKGETASAFACIKQAPRGMHTAEQELPPPDTLLDVNTLNVTQHLKFKRLQSFNFFCCYIGGGWDYGSM